MHQPVGRRDANAAGEIAHRVGRIQSLTVRARVLSSRWLACDASARTSACRQTGDTVTLAGEQQRQARHRAAIVALCKPGRFTLPLSDLVDFLKMLADSCSTRCSRAVGWGGVVETLG